MFRSISRYGVVFLTLALFVAGCATQPGSQVSGTAVPSSSATTSSPSTTESVSTASDPGIVTASSDGPELQYNLVPENSEARYRVREQLAKVSFPTDAVGKTKQISGSVYVKSDGSIDSSKSKIVVDLSSLQSDESMRDNFVRRSILGTSQYQNAVFVPAKISGLPSPLPKSGDVSFQVIGDLTIKDVTKPVTWDVTGKVEGNHAVGTATTKFTFEDFNLSQPRVPVVLSVVNSIALEVDVDFQAASGS